MKTMDNPDTPEATPFEQALQDALTDAEAFGQPDVGPVDIVRPSEDEAGLHGTD